MPVAARDRERVTLLDWCMLALAVFSLGLLVFEQAYGDRLTAQQRQQIIYADLAIVAVFALEFTYRVSRAADKWGYAKSHWYDLLGMVPVSHPLFRSFRLFRILRIVVITSRFVRATNRTFGEATFESVVGRYRDILVEEITDAVILRSLDALEPPLTRARMAARIGDTVDAHRAHIHELVEANIRGTPGLAMLARVETTRRLIDQVEDVVLDTVIRSLRSDELNQVVSESIRGVLGEIREEVKVRDAGGAGRAPAAVAS